MKLADSVMAGKTSDGSIKWQLCYDISARTWWMVSWHNIFFFFFLFFLSFFRGRTFPPPPLCPPLLVALRGFISKKICEPLGLFVVFMSLRRPLAVLPSLVSAASR